MSKGWLAKAGLWAGLAASGLAAGCGPAAPEPGHTVERVELKRYLGRWYEIARLPNDFQEGCRCTTAEYERHPEGGLRVINSCRREGGRDTAEGRARVVPGSGGARLEVTFFWPFSGDYWIIALDPDYRWAVVGHPEREYLWILSRRPTLPQSVAQRLRARARELDYPVERLVFTDQGCHTGPTAAAPASPAGGGAPAY
jgi:apolipoprotein D and lipocalin family protein